MSRSLKILILEDSTDDVDLIERELRKGGITFTSTVVTRRDDYERALNEVKPDVILSDHALPHFNSIEALKLYQRFRDQALLMAPFILVTGTVSEEFAVQCIRAGADDYVLKDRLKRLPSSVESALQKTHIESERKKFLDKVIVNEAMMKEAEHIANFGSWQLDLRTGEHKWSDQAYRIYGYEPGEMVPSYEKFLSHVHPEDIAALKEANENALDHLDSYESEFRIVDKNGNLKYLDTRIMIHRDKESRPIRLIGFNHDITERKKAEIRLRKSEQEYKSLFDQNPNPVYSLDLQGRFTNVNNALSALSGLSVAGLLQTDFKRFLREEDRERVSRYFLEATRGNPQRYQANFINSAGSALALDITNMPIVVHGRIVGVHGVAIDITEKKELETLLARAHRLALIGGWEVDVADRKVSWTAITKALHEVPDNFESDLETCIRFYKAGESRETISKAVKDAIEKGTPWDLELPLITAKGNERWVRTIGEAEFKDGKCVRLWGSFQDVNARKQAEETLKEAYREKSIILESIGDGFFAVDKKWTVTYWNKVAEEKLSMPREKIIGENLWEIYTDAIPLSFYTHYHRAMNENVAVHFEEHYPTLNIWLEVSVYPSVAGLSVYFRDVTKERSYIKEIEEQNAKLREIAWTQSHRVRAPLARLMGLVNLIRDHNNTKAEEAGILDHITNAAVELDGIIRKIVRKTEEIDSNENAL